MAKKPKSPALISLEDELQKREGLALTNFLRDNSIKIIDDDKIFIAYDEETQGLKNSAYAQASISLSREEEELAEYVKSRKADLKMKKIANKQLLKDIGAGGEYTQGKVYLFDDQDARLMYEFTEDGELIRQRQLRPDERQTNIVTESRRVSNGE